MLQEFPDFVQTAAAENGLSPADLQRFHIQNMNAGYSDVTDADIE